MQLSEMTVEQGSWVRKVENFLTSFTTRLNHDKDVMESNVRLCMCARMYICTYITSQSPRSHGVECEILYVCAYVRMYIYCLTVLGVMESKVRYCMYAHMYICTYITSQSPRSHGVECETLYVCAYSYVRNAHLLLVRITTKKRIWNRM